MKRTYETPARRTPPYGREGIEGASTTSKLGSSIGTKVGLPGFSSSAYYTNLSALSHSHYPIAAARLPTGSTRATCRIWCSGYPDGSGTIREEDGINGGRPWGAALQLVRRAGFNVDRIRTPPELTALTGSQRCSSVGPYAGLLLQGNRRRSVHPTGRTSCQAVGAHDCCPQQGAEGMVPLLA